MGDHHVLEGAGGLVELDPVVDAERLGHVDLHVVDVVPVPDRLEEAVGEAEGQDVLRRLLAEEVVDAEDLILVEVLVQHVVEGDRAGQVGPEGLLHDDPRPLDQLGVGQHLDHVAVRCGRDAEIVQPARLTADGVLGLAHGLGQRLGPGRSRAEGQPSLEVGPLQQRDLARGVLVAGVAGQVAEVLVAQVAGGAPDDPVLGHHPGHGEVEQPGQQLACRQVARGAEEDDDMRLDLGRGRRRGHRLAAVDDLGHDAGRRSLSSDTLRAHDLRHRLGRELLQLGHPVGRLGQALDVGPVGPEDDPVVAHEVDDLVDVVLPERVDPHVAPERVDGVLGEVARHAPRRRAQLAEQGGEELRAVLDRGDAHVGEAVEELLEDERGQEVVRRPLDGEHLDARAPRPGLGTRPRTRRPRSRWTTGRRRRRAPRP